MSYLFSLSRYQIKCVIELLFRQLMMSRTLWFFFNHPLKQWPTGRKRGKARNKKKWISWEQQAFFREIKSIFHRFWRTISWWKNINENKNLMKIADTSFKACVCYFFSHFYYFTKWWHFKNYEKCFLLHLKTSFRSQDIQILEILSLPFQTFQIQKDKLKWNNLWCHELACIN